MAGEPKGERRIRECKECGKEWVFFYRKAIDKIDEGNVKRFRVCCECAARRWHNEQVFKQRFLH
jgi:DNA-directed RNA polymerase subunit M/transcription elongation factor TFIIS